MPYLDLVNLEALIAPLQEEEKNDLLTGLSVFIDGAIKLHVP